MVRHLNLTSNSSLSRLVGLKFTRSGKPFELILESDENTLKLWDEFLRTKLNHSELNDSYKIIKKIGQGSFAEVYMGNRIEDG